MKISLVIPAYNQARYLSEAIESVLAQTLTPHEIITVDDGSTDETEEVCRRFADPVKCLAIQHSGPAEARNRGLSECTGDAVMFLDADDTLSTGWVEQATKAYLRAEQKGTTPGVVYGYYVLFREPAGYRKRIKTRKVTVERLLRDPLVLPSGALVSRKCLDEVGLFREAFAPCEDWDYWLRAATAGYRFIRVAACAFMHREHEAGLSKQELHALHKRVQLLGSWLESAQLSRRQRLIARQELARTLLRLYRASHYHSQTTDDFLARAMEVDPDILQDPRLFLFGAVYVSPYFRQQITPEDVKGAIESLGEDVCKTTANLGGSVDKKRLEAGKFLALGANDAFDRAYWPAIMNLFRAMKADPTLLRDAPVRLVAEAQRVLRWA